MYLLAHPKLHNTVVETARIDLLNFLKEYEWCYGSGNLVYNVHSLQHLPDDVRAHGPLDSFSAFPFESYMRQIKDSVHSGFAVANQAAQRYAEKLSFCDRLQITGLPNTPIGANHVSSKQSNEREQPYQFDCGILSQQFRLSSEEELQMLDTGLQHQETRDRLLRALTNRFLSSSVNEKDLAKLYNIATQGYFHGVRDKVIKRKRRRKEQVYVQVNRDIQSSNEKNLPYGIDHGDQSVNFFKPILNNTTEIQSRDTEFWRYIREVTCEQLQSNYQRMNIQFTSYEYESDYVEKAYSLANMLLANGLAYKSSDGLTCMSTANNNDVNFSNQNIILLKSDKSTLYLTR
ncbi:unnamed protein product [Schistosoma mattheei]|uniref:Uncharacterized protein n=1 Tax=Schistosoma mattheei TaxID=31246 RepID=A0A183P374_9TREM|nr:unnamed protein product [Schistosoma mattheei]